MNTKIIVKPTTRTRCGDYVHCQTLHQIKDGSKIVGTVHENWNEDRKGNLGTVRPGTSERNIWRYFDISLGAKRVFVKDGPLIRRFKTLDEAMTSLKQEISKLSGTN